jgi:colanic acid biosynthesis glycosyl transferase WcaI
MKKSILLIGYNFSPEPTGIGKYSGEQIEWLAKNGYKCTVLATYPYYPYWKVQEPYVRSRFWYRTERQYFDSGGSITIHRCPMYIPAKPSGVKRILLDLSFLVSAFFKLVQLLPAKKFDIVVTILPSVTLGLLGIFYKKIKGAKLLCHVHDLQIEAARDLKMIKSEKAIKALFRLEKFIFDKCDAITCVGEGMARKVKEKALKDSPLFFNTTDLTLFHPIADRDRLKLSFGFNPADKVILYSGAIGEKQGIETILYAAQELQSNTRLKFVICGSGPFKDKLRSLAKSLKLQNVSFMPLQPIERFNRFLNMADVHLIVQKANAGDLVMPSKLNTVLAIGGVALITADKGSGMYSLVQNHQMGILVEAENQKALNKGILQAVTENTSEIALNARQYAESYLSIERIMKNFEASFLISDSRATSAFSTMS